MAKGTIYPAESRTFQDARTGVSIRQVTNHPSMHHHPFFFVPAYDDAMRRLVFVSCRTGTPQAFAEDRASGSLIQLTDRPDLNDWSIYPSHDGRALFFTAGLSGWRLDLETLEEQELVRFGAERMREEGMVGAAMGTTALSHDDRWWAVRFNDASQGEGSVAALAVIDTETGRQEVILRRDSVGHMQFCPDDAGLLFYAGPLTDRVWLIHRDGSGNRRLYARNAEKKEWITHESWIPGTRELAFVDWPHGIRCIHVDTGVERRVTSFNAWHPICNRHGTLMVADTTFPDIGLQLFDPLDGEGKSTSLCHAGATNQGEHWKGPFPYGQGPVKVYAPQHTHPHPSFSPDGKRVVFTSDRTGHSQIYETLWR
jgi:oligogalacturonide lyase